MNRSLSCLIFSLALATSARAAPEPGLVRPAYLPDDAMILSVLEASPALAEARAALAGARAEARMLAAGEHEVTATFTADQRRVRADGDYGEWSAQISRAWRSPGKRILDLSAGSAGARAANDAMDDARHQASLRLAQLWVGWLEAEARAAIDRAEVETYAKDAAALARRVELKDAARLDLELAQAALARAQSVAIQSAGQAEVIRAELDVAFPGLTPVAAPALPPPAAPLRPLEAWLPLIPQRSHEITIARALADRDDALARRAKLDQRPDPTLGLRTFNERGGAETGAGLTLSIPLGGARRSANTQRQVAAASAAEARYAMVVRDVELSARRDVIGVRSGLREWAQTQSAEISARDATARVQRAYELGERDLSDLLTARRLGFEAQRLELAARARTHNALLCLALDAHELWLTEESEGG